MTLQLTEPTTEQDWSDYYRLRYERLRRPLGLAPGSERDDPAESSSVHVIAKLDGRVVAAGCWVVGIKPGRDRAARTIFVRFRQLAVDAAYEGRGIGGAMTRHVEERARALGAIEIVGNVRDEQVPYFRRHGWLEQGPGVTLYDTVASTAMVKPLRPADAYAGVDTPERTSS